MISRLQIRHAGVADAWAAWRLTLAGGSAPTYLRWWIWHFWSWLSFSSSSVARLPAFSGEFDRRLRRHFGLFTSTGEYEPAHHSWRRYDIEGSVGWPMVSRRTASRSRWPAAVQAKFLPSDRHDDQSWRGSTLDASSNTELAHQRLRLKGRARRLICNPSSLAADVGVHQQARSQDRRFTTSWKILSATDGRTVEIELQQRAVVFPTIGAGLSGNKRRSNQSLTSDRSVDMVKRAPPAIRITGRGTKAATCSIRAFMFGLAVWQCQPCGRCHIGHSARSV